MGDKSSVVFCELISFLQIVLCINAEKAPNAAKKGNNT